MTIRIRLSNDWAPGLHHGEAGLHEHHQGAAQDQPEAENAVDWVVIIEINEENPQENIFWNVSWIDFRNVRLDWG
jgi:hypothetical protein